MSASDRSDDLDGATTTRERIEPFVPLLLFVAFVVVRLPFRSEFLVNWDAVNFALGIESFDLGTHQPHAPGYIGYIVLGRALAALTGDANSGLTLLSVLAGGALPATAYLLAKRFLRSPYALLAAVLLGSSPVVWYYSSVALTYVVSAALTVPFVWAAVTARVERSRRHLLIAAVLLAVVGAIRQTDLVLLLPVFVYAAWPHAPRVRWQAAGTLAVLSAVWVVPLILLAGGPVRYVALSAELAELAGGRTFAIGAGFRGWVQNIGLVAVGVVLGLNVGLLAVPAALRARRTGLEGFGRQGRMVLLLWVAPALLTYLFVHTGQIGYVLLVLPALALWVGAVAQDRAGAAAPRAASPAPTTRLGKSAVMVAVVNTAMFLGFPPTASAMFSMDGGDRVGAAMTSLVEDGGIVERTRQYDLARNDAYWKEAVAFAESFDPEETVILAVPASGGSFRHLGYYLDEYRVYGVGRDRTGDFGHLFTAQDGRTDYAIAGLRSADASLELPEDVRWVLVPDRVIQASLTGLEPARRLRVEAAPDILAYAVEPGSELLFLEPWDDLAQMTVWPPSRAGVVPAPRFQHETPPAVGSIG